MSKEIGPVKIQGITTGKIVDYGMEDPMNMGACMAPAAAEVIYQHFVDFGSKPEDYDAVIYRRSWRSWQEDFVAFCFVKMV